VHPVDQRAEFAGVDEQRFSPAVVAFAVVFVPGEKP
jgi:hypothetical protein